MKKSEILKLKRKIKFKYFILARILTLFFAMVFFLPAGGPVASAAGLSAEAAGNFFDFNQESAYSEPFSRLIEFLNEKKNELEKYDGDFLGGKALLIDTGLRGSKSGVDEAVLNPAVSSFASAVFESVKSFVADNPKQYFGTVFKSVKNFVFPGDSQNDFEYNSPNSLSAEEAGESAAQEMENLKQQYAEAIDETKAISQNFNLLQNELEKIKNSGVVVRQPVIEQKAVERTIEKIVSGLSQSDLDSGLSNLRTELNNFNTNLLNQINTLSASSNRQTSAVYQAVSLTNKIDSLSGTRLTNVTVSGVTGLADSDIPDGITASNYLLLTGGTITGSTTISGQTNLSNATTSLLTVSNGAWFTSGNVGIGTTSPYAKLSVVGPVVAEYFHATSTTATSTFSGQTVSGFAPTLAHNFGSWSSGVSGANPLGASLIINPSSAVTDSNLLSLSVNGSAKFLVDAEGDIFANAVTVVGGTTLSTTTASTFTVENNTYLGDATTTDITYFNSRIADSLIPTADNLLDLGDSANWLRWRTGYFGTSVGIGGTATSTGTQLTTSGAYLINSNGTLSVNTTNNQAVSFGTGNVSIPYASSTALTISGSAYIGSLNGPLQANNGLVSATTSVGSIYGGTGINSSALTGLAQIVSGTWSASSTLSTAFGGTGWGNLQANTVLLGNGAGRLATTSAGTDGYVLGLSAGVPTWLATSTLSTITGTLTVAKGGTGQTSFGQGWLNSDGATLTSSTSPTVNYIYATSTTATSTFAGGMSVAGSSGLTVLQNGNVGIGTASPDSALDIAKDISAGSGAKLIDLSGSTLGTDDHIIYFRAEEYWKAGGNLRATGFVIGAASVANSLSESSNDITLAAVGDITLDSGRNTVISQGNVGIGTPSPAAKLHTLSTTEQLRLGYDAGNYWSGTVGSTGGLTLAGTGAGGALTLTPTAGQNLNVNLSTTGDFAVNTNQLYVDTSSGNVGIGTTSPYAKLSVVGPVVAEYFYATSTTATSTFAGGMSVAGSSGLTVLQNGNVGIGTAAPTLGASQSLTARQGMDFVLGSAAKGTNGIFYTTDGALGDNYLNIVSGTNGGITLDIKNNDTADSFNVRYSSALNATADTSGFIMTGSGLVGIGTTSPYAKLSVAGETVSSYFTATTTTASTFPYASTTALTISGNSYLGTVSSGAWNGTVVGAQYGGTGLNSSALTGIAQIVSGTWSASSTLSVAFGGTGWNSIAAGYIPFGNGAAALATSTSFYWDNSNSRLGIGTTTPNSKLTVFASADDSAIEFSSASGSTYKWTMGMDYSDAGKFKIASSTALGSIDRFTIDGNGYVGIGTSTPARRLEVADSGNNNPQMRLSRETNVYTDFSVAQTTGDLSLSLYGTNADDISLYMPDGSTGANLWVCEGAACPNGISFTGGGNLFVEGVIKYATSTTPKTRRSIILTAAGAIVPATSGAAKTQVDGTNHSYYVLDYDASSDEAAYWQWTMPDSYDNGTIDVTYYWEAGATSGDATLCFQAKGLSANSSEDIDSALSSAVCETDTAQANANDLASITETNATSNFTAGEYATFKVFRDADAGGDTMTGDARLVKVKIEYGVATESD